MLSNAAASGLAFPSAAIGHSGEPAAYARSRAGLCVVTDALKVRVTPPMPTAVQGTRVPTTGVNGAGNGNAGVAAAAASRKRCG